MNPKTQEVVNQVILDYPEQGPPVCEWLTKHISCLCFVTLFPWGYGCPFDEIESIPKNIRHKLTPRKRL